MAVLRDMYMHVMPSVQGCPVGLVDNAIRQSLIDFCERTNMWKYSFDKVDVVADQATYSFTQPADSLISKPTFVSCNDIPLFPTNEDDLDSFDYTWRTATSAQPTMYYMDYDNNLIVVPTPTTDLTAALKLEVALKPTSNATTYPDWLIDNWAETIAHGALMRLHSMPGKVWADVQIVNFHRTKFKDGITRAKSRTMKSFSRQGKSVQPRQFWE